MRQRGRQRVEGRRLTTWGSRPLVILSFTVTPNPVATGATATFAATWAGGTGPYTYFFVNGESGGGGGGPQDETTATADFTYSVGTTYTARVTITDANGMVAVATTPVTVA